MNTLKILIYFGIVIIYSHQKYPIVYATLSIYQTLPVNIDIIEHLNTFIARILVRDVYHPNDNKRYNLLTQLQILLKILT